MATMKNYGLAGVGSDVQLGKDGGVVDYGTGTAGEFTLTDSASAAGQLNIALTPTANTHAGSKKYIDDQIQQYVQGLDVKQSVDVATTGNVALTGEQTIDGVLTSGSRILVKDQTNPTENGIYVTGAGAWTRAADADNSPENEVSGGMFTFVEQGTVNADSGWSLTSPAGIASLGVDNLVFSQFSGAGAITGGNGIDVTGTVVSADNDGVTITSTGGSGTQNAVYGGTANQQLISAGAADAAWGWADTVYDANGVAAVSTTATASAVNWLNVTNGDATTSVVDLGISGSGVGSTNADLQLSAAGTGFVILPSGTSFTGAPDNAVVNKGYVDAALDAGNFQIASDDTFTYVRTESTNGASSDMVEIAVGDTGAAVPLVTFGKPSGSTDNSGSAAFSSGSNGLQIFSQGDDLPNSVNDEVRIEAFGTATDVDIRLVPAGAGQVFIGDTGQGVIQADNNFALSAIGGDSDGTANAGALNLLGGNGSSSFTSGDVNIAGGFGGGADGGVNITHQYADNAFNNIMLFDGVASAVNYFQTTNSASGNAVSIAAAGTDSNVDIELAPKGTGDVVVPSGYVPDTAYSLVTKTYADTLVGAADLDWQADTGGALNIDLDDEVMTFAGGSNVNTAGALNTLTINLDTTLTGMVAATFSGQVQAGTVLADSGLTVTSGGATITAGGLTVSSGNTTLGGTLDVAGTIEGNDSLNLVDNANDGEVAITATAGTATDVDLLLDAAGAGFVILPSGTSFAGAPTNAVATTGYVDDAIAANTDELTFRTGVATSAAKVIGTMNNVAGKSYMVTRVVVDVTTPFDTDPAGDRIDSAGLNTIITDADLDIGTVGTYVIDVYDEAVDHGGLALNWTAVTAATTGAATVTIEYKAVTPTA